MRPSADLVAETRRILSLAWPVVLTGLNWTILHLTDVVFVGMTGTAEAAALGASRTITFIGLVVGLGALTGVLVFVSRADGAKDLRETGRVFHQGLALGLGFAFACAIPLYAFALPMLLAVGVEPRIAPAAANVVRVMAFAYPSQLLIIVSSFFLEGVSRPRRVTAVNLSILPVNALLAWALSGGHLGLPALGAVGAALATAIASWMGAAGMLYAAWTLPRARERGVHALDMLFSRATLTGAARLLRFGAVPAIARGLELAGFSILIALSTQLGEVPTHAFQIVFSIHNVTFALGLGFGSAAGVRAGNAVGEGRAEDATRRIGIAAVLSAASSGVLALALLLWPGATVALFPAVPEVHALAIAMLLVWAPFVVLDAVQVVFVDGLRSLGDQVVAGINSIIAFFLITGGVGIWLVAAGWGAYALVAGSAAGMAAAVLLNGARLWWINSRFRSRS